MAIRNRKDAKATKASVGDTGKKRLTGEDLADAALMEQAERDYGLGLGGSIDEVFAAVYRARGESEPAQKRPRGSPKR